MFNPGRDDRRFAELRLAALDTSPVSGLTHCHYKYPARFSPKFVSAVLKEFSKPGDLVLDPYMGGGTTIVEAIASGRRAVGCDLNSLAVFVTRAKTIKLTSLDERKIYAWATSVVPSLSYHDTDYRVKEALCEKRTRNLHLPHARPIKKFIALALVSLDALDSLQAKDFARCALLNVSQWALNGRRTQVALSDFRMRLTQVALDMLQASASLRSAMEVSRHVDAFSSLIHDSAENLASHSPFSTGERADLVVTSPPYPGVHILYHRWQVNGRRETPAPYWIADCLDGNGESYYTFGTRKEERHSEYFKQSLRTLESIRSVMKDGAVMAQIIAFSNPRSQLKRYLDNMSKAGFKEVCTSTGRPARAWRDVPGRSWHASLQGSTHSAREVALLHVAA
jgi:DNA modification methylase